MTLFLCNFLLCFLYVFFYNKACNWSIWFLQIVNISKLYHVLGSNHSTFYVWSFQSVVSIQIFSLKNAIPSINKIHVKNDYFPLPSKFEMWASKWYIMYPIHAIPVSFSQFWEESMQGTSTYPHRILRHFTPPNSYHCQQS
jgi:hypothetical protein